MIPKHGFACLTLLAAIMLNAPAQAAMTSNSDTTIGAMEEKLFSHSFSTEGESDRLSRLEKLVFGGPSTDISISDRLNRLSACVSAKSKTLAPITLAGQSPVANTRPNLANVSSYPRVTQLEMRLLGKSYFGEPIAKRLSRLEINEFGAASTSNDLAGRMDALTAITTSNEEKRKINELASYQSPTTIVENYRNHVNQLFQLAPAVQKEQPNTVVDQIEYLESTAFGKTHPNKPLQKRVDALEEKYFGASKVEAKNLTYRVAQLLSLVNNTGSRTFGEHS